MTAATEDGRCQVRDGTEALASILVVNCRWYLVHVHTGVSLPAQLTASAPENRCACFVAVILIINVLLSYLQI